MTTWIPPQPANLVELSFLDARFNLIDIAAFLDRVQRAGQDGDFRVQALKKAIALLSQNEPQRAKDVLLSLSDPTADPIPKATIQGALGAWKTDGLKG
ncbi:MAG: hypothetical protein K8R87_01300 [Verrucomicrobia bacterium]|nr:hypothetical protein [Verrucomicrobiota bacterium]